MGVAPVGELFASWMQCTEGRAEAFVVEVAREVEPLPVKLSVQQGRLCYACNRIVTVRMNVLFLQAMTCLGIRAEELTNTCKLNMTV